MNPEEKFSDKKFLQALQSAKELKTNMKPFIETFEAMNIPWIFDALHLLRNVIRSSKYPAKIRLHGLFALKMIFSTCNYIVVNVVETYFLDFLVRMAEYDKNKEGKERGVRYYLEHGHKESESQNIQTYGFNAVTLATEMIRGAAIIKPKKTYFNQQTEDKSNFTFAFERIQKSLKSMPNTWDFFKKESPQALHERFIENLLLFGEQKIQAYSVYVEKAFYDSLKAGFAEDEKHFDIRQFLKGGDYFVIDGPLEVVKEALVKGKPSTILNSLNFINSMVLSGFPQVSLALHENRRINLFVKSILQLPENDKSLQRGKDFLDAPKFNPTQKKELYYEFLKSLEFWAHTYLKTNPKTNKISKIARYYDLLKNVKNYEFPKNQHLQEQIKMTSISYQRNKGRNKLFLQDMIDEFVDEETVSFLQKTAPPKQAKQPQSSLKGNNSAEKEKEEVKKVPVEIKEEQKKIDIKKEVKPAPPLKSVILDEEENILQKIKSKEKELKDKKQEIKNQPFKQSVKQEQEVKKESVKDIKSQPKQDLKKENSEVKNDPANMPPAPVEKASNKNLSVIKEQTSYNSKESISGNIRQPSVISKQEEIKKSKINVKKSDNSDVRQTPKHEQIRQSEIIRESIDGVQFQNRLDKGMMILNDLKTKENVIKKRFEILMEQKKYFEAHVDKVEFDEEKTEDCMNKYFKFIDKMDILENEYEKYEKERISFAELVAKLEPSSNSKKDSRKENKPLDVIKLQIPLSQKDIEREERVHFPSASESKVSEKPEDIVESVDISIIEEKLTNQAFSGYKSFARKFKKPSDSPIKYLQQEESKLPQFSKEDDGEFKSEHKPSEYRPQQIGYHEQKKIQKYEEKQMKNYEEMKEFIEEKQVADEYIQGPSLFPLEQSYYDIENEKAKNRQINSFKEALAVDKFLKRGKRENLFWLQSQTETLIKPAGNHKRTSSKVNIPELIEQKNKKFQSQINLLQNYTQKTIKDLRKRLQQLEDENKDMKKELRVKDSQINSLKEQSQSRSQEKFNIMEDEFLFKFKNAKNKTERSIEKGIVAKFSEGGRVLNLNMFDQYFTDIITQKDKKKQLKNKELFFKNDLIQVGFMGHRQDNKYILCCYVTPEKDIQIQSLKINKNDNLSISFDKSEYEGKIIRKNKQYKMYFTVEVLQTPYFIPEVLLQFMSNSERYSISFILPCAFHKFFKIQEIGNRQLRNYFQEYPILRGVEVTYSKKVLKHNNILADYLSHIKKLDDEEGEMCYGGMASYGDIEFPVKIRIKENQFLYVQCVNIKERSESEKVIKFYIATLNKLLRKEGEM